MTTSETNHLAEVTRYVIRPTLVEGRLVTNKQADDTRYLVRLAEELRQAEMKIAALEQALHLAPSAGEPRQAIDDVSAEQPDINWIRTKSCQLSSRLRRIEGASTADAHSG